jgi:hypothetical protein
VVLIIDTTSRIENQDETVRGYGEKFNIRKDQEVFGDFKVVFPIPHYLNFATSLLSSMASAKNINLAWSNS